MPTKTVAVARAGENASGSQLPSAGENATNSQSPRAGESPAPAQPVARAQPVTPANLPPLTAVQGKTQTEQRLPDDNVLRPIASIRVTLLEQVTAADTDFGKLIHARTIQPLFSGNRQLLVPIGTDVFLRMTIKESSNTRLHFFVVDYLVINGKSVSVPTRELIRTETLPPRPGPLLQASAILNFVATNAVQIPR